MGPSPVVANGAHHQRNVSPWTTCICASNKEKAVLSVVAQEQEKNLCL